MAVQNELVVHPCFLGNRHLKKRSTTDVYLMRRPSSKRDHYFRKLWKGANSEATHKRKFICSAFREVVRCRCAYQSPTPLGDVCPPLPLHKPRPNRRGFFQAKAQIKNIEIRPLSDSKPASTRSPNNQSPPAAQPSHAAPSNLPKCVT
jgi:hypothetical protein